MSKPVFFSTPDKLNAWFRKYGNTRDELICGYYKKATGKPSVTWEESVDEALCFGWIDGIRRRIDEEAYQIRFTPRRPRSIWSRRNLERVKVLLKEKRMQADGIAAYQRRKEDNSEVYAYEQGELKLPPQYEQKIKKSRKAWAYFQSLARSYKKPSINWVISAKKEETRLRRLEQLIACCADEVVLPQFIPRKKK
ncbi:MAG: YdeI/OmpD-associated family protein [Planctomycetota bacterium]